MNKELGRYADEITDAVAASTTVASDSDVLTRLTSLINGEPQVFVSSVLDRKSRRQDGIFFSGKAWAARLADMVNLAGCQRFVDPSCGTGDLLLEIANRLPLRDCPRETIRDWSEKLVGTDIHEPFVRIAWGRITALAVLRHERDKFAPLSAQDLLIPRSWGVKNGLIDAPSLRPNDCVIMNPPYHRTKVYDSLICEGSITSAAVFLENALIAAPAGVIIIALVPDVIRSGSRYQKLRDLISSKAEIKSFEPVGEFGPEADIDVAILFAKTKNDSRSQQSYHFVSPSKFKTVGNLFHVHVGSVVPHRTPTSGHWRPYLTVASVSPWEELMKRPKKRRFSAAPFKGPFVVIRRTSSPSDKQRARASLVTISDDIYVENHLIVCQPKDGRLETCRELVDVLSRKSTDDWLNYRIRCRHLTVGAVAEIPWKLDS